MFCVKKFDISVIFFLISWCDFDRLQMMMKLLFTIPDTDIRYSMEAASKHKVCYEQEWQQQFAHQTKIVENLHHSTMKKVSSYKTWCCVCITDRNETVIQVIPRMIQCLSKQLWYSNTILAPQDLKIIMSNIARTCLQIIGGFQNKAPSPLWYFTHLYSSTDC